MEFWTEVAGKKLQKYICNASGPLDATFNQLQKIAESESSAIVMKSATVKPREGNPEPRFARLKLGAIQSMGLPNLGYKKYIEFADKLNKYNKPIIASVAGLSLDDYVLMVEAFQKSSVDLIEVNLSCPNVKGKPIVAYDFEQTEKVLENIKNSGKKPLGLKLPPYYDFSHHEQMAELIKKYKIKFITTINSIGNTLIIDPNTEKTIIRPKKGFGGLSGSYIKPIALANVRIFYELLKGKVSIFGVGGITTGKDAFEFLLAGADAVQVATTFEKEGPSCFERLNKEFYDFLEKKGYNSIEEVKGKLKLL